MSKTPQGVFSLAGIYENINLLDGKAAQRVESPLQKPVGSMFTAVRCVTFTLLASVLQSQGNKWFRF